MTELSTEIPPRKPALLERAWVGYLLTAVVMLGVVGWHLGQAGLDEHEAKAALAAREMYQPNTHWATELEPPGGCDLSDPDILHRLDDPRPPQTQFNRWMIPINNASPRLVKTPMPYWLMAGAAMARGEFDNVTARLVSAVAALLVVWVTLALGRRMFDPRTALLGALVLATMMGLQKWGRNARPEMILCLMCTVAMACFYCAMTAGAAARRNGWLLAFWLAMAAANMSKQFVPLLLGVPLLAYLGWRQSDQDAAASPKRSPRKLAAIYSIVTGVAIVAAILMTSLFSSEKVKAVVMAAMVMGPLAWYLLATRGLRQIPPLLATAVPGAIVMCAFLAWMGYMMHLFPNAGDIFNEQVGERVTGSGKWVASEAYYYILPLISLSLPWVAFLPGALACPWMQRFADHRKPLLFLFFWVALFLGLLTLSAGKREHYPLPTLPALALLMGFIANDVLFAHRWISVKLAKAIGIGYGVTMLIGPAILWMLWNADKAYGEKFLYMFYVSLISAAIGVATIALFVRGRVGAGFGAIVLAMIVLYAGLATRMDLWNGRDEIAQFLRESATIVGDDKAFHWGDVQMKLPYHFHHNIPNIFWTQCRMTKELGPEKAQQAFDAWLKNPRQVPWIFVTDTRIEKELAAQGFKPAHRLDFVEHGFKLKKMKLVPAEKVQSFVLMKNENAQPQAESQKL